ncbi:unnamed protein product [Candidula unifasciata]|uniref:SAMD1-like winged helix (WH) domain-containing protein n=1 Tax=Candidula unifasciata TaxID=100452 RepID=A0A8S3YPR7_9EUPU|nr:unnamed protein product [Candidula unifasciata]
MFQENEKEWILEAINHLKHRKARPDLSRISLRMKRKYQMSFAQTKKLLESLIECGIVVKAVYKNNTSYRDVSQWKKGRLGGQILNSNKMLKRFIRAIEATEESKGTGVSAKDIEDFLASQGEEKCFLSGAALRDALENEIINGYLKKLSAGTQFHYTINTENINSASDIVTQEGDDVDEENLDLRENSSHYEDSSFSLHSENLEAGPLLTNVMKAINETEQLERSGSSLLDIKEYLLIKGHEFSDTDDSFLLAFLEKHSRNGVLKKVVQDSVVFYSIPEKALDINRENSMDCTPTSDDIPRAFGLVSVKDEINSTVDHLPAPPPHPIAISFAPGAFHEYRSLSSAVPLRPPSKRKRIVKDHGPDFETEIPTRMKKHTDIKESVYPTPTASPASEKSETTMEQSFKMEGTKKRGRPKKPESPSGEHGQDDNSKQDGQSEQSDNEDDDSSLPSSHPDIFSWSPQQVADYFHKKGYVEEAKSMLANDLDGAALGLLRRSDVVGPPLGGLLKVKKLGVALKLFRDIRDLLYQGNVDNYMDPYEERAFLRS